MSDHRKTLGYIVLGGDNSPVIWRESEGRFFSAITSSQRPATNLFQPGEYEHIRSLIARHYRTLASESAVYNQNRLHGLFIVRLVSA